MPRLLRLLHKGLVRADVAVAIGCAAVVLAAWVFVVERVRYEERDAAADGQRLSRNMALAFEQQTIRHLQSIDQLVHFIRHEYVEDGARINLPDIYGYSMIEKESILYAGVVDEHGLLRFSSNAPAGLDLSDRDFVRYHRDERRDLVHIGHATTDRVRGRSVVNFSRRISARDGGFLGVAVVGIAPDYLGRSAAHFDLGARGQLILLGEDGWARARRVGAVLRSDLDMSGSTLFQHAKQADAGTYVSRGRADGVPRFMSFQRLRDYPLIVAVGVSIDDALAGARARAQLYYGAAAFGTALALLVSAALLAALRRQKRARDEQRFAEQRYRATFDQAPVGIAEHRPDGTFLNANARYCGMVGYSKEELRGKTFFDVLHPDDAGFARRDDPAFLSGLGPKVLTVQTRHVRKDGSLLWGAGVVSRVESADGEPYLVAMIEDITERKAAEEAARESQERFRQLADNIGEVFWLADPKTTQVYYVSRAYETVWGRSCDSLYASPSGWADAIHPDDRERVLNADRSKRSAGNYVQEYRIVRPDGEVRWIRDRAFPVLRNGELYRFAGIAEDITPALAAEKKLADAGARDHATFELAAVGITHTSLDGRFLTANRKFCQMLGYSEAELATRRFVDVTCPEDLPASQAKLRDLLALEADAFVPPFEKRYLRKDGTTMWAVVSPAIVRGPDGAPQYFVTMMQDITARKRAEAQLLEQLDELRRFQKATIERELRMIELEAQLNELKSRVAA